MPRNLIFKLLATCFVPIILLIATTSANAERWSKQYHVDYTLGDNDNRTEARKIAINKLRMMAAADAGKYIQGDEVLVDDKYASGIHMATAAIVSIRDAKETTTINDAGQAVLHLTAMATVDDSVLKKRIDAIRKDAGLAARLADEDNRVAALFQRMAELNGNLAAAEETAKMYRLMGERVRVEADIQSIFGQSRKEFAPGELKEIANRYAAAQKKKKIEDMKAEKRAQAEEDLRNAENRILQENEVQNHIAWLQQHFYQPLLKNTTLDTSINQVIPSEGGGYDITATLNWNTHMQCPAFHFKKSFRDRHPIPSVLVGLPLAFAAFSVAAVVDIGTFGTLHATKRLNNMFADNKDEQIEAWENDPKTQESVLFNLGGCSADGMEHTPLFFPYSKQYLRSHHVVIKLALASKHRHVKYIPVFDGKFFHPKESDISIHFHVSDKEIDAIQEIEAAMEVKVTQS